MDLRADGLRLLHMARCEGGAIAPMVGVMLPIIFAMLGLVEAGKVYGLKNQLQATADAAAMASVLEVPNGIAPVREKAIKFAELNMPAAEQFGGAPVLIDDDVAWGNWDADRAEGDRFRRGDEQVNAVQVMTRGEMPLFFSGALRSLGVGVPESFTPFAEAIALLRPDKCYDNGFVAGGTISMNSSNTFKSGFCVYGHDGVSMTSSNFFEAGTGVGMSDLDANWTALEAGFQQNDGLEEALFEKYVAPPVATAAKQMIDDLLLGNGPMGMPVKIDTWPPPNGITAGTLYHVAAAVGINVKQDDPPLQGVGIISDVSVTVKSNSKLRDVTLGSSGPVNIDSNVVFGDADFCTTGQGKSLILSGNNLTGNKPATETNSNIKLYGVQMISDGSIEMNSNLIITGASIQSSGDIDFNSRFDVAGCPDGTSPNVTGGETMVSQLVD